MRSFVYRSMGMMIFLVSVLSMACAQLLYATTTQLGGGPASSLPVLDIAERAASLAQRDVASSLVYVLVAFVAMFTVGSVTVAKFVVRYIERLQDKWNTTLDRIGAECHLHGEKREEALIRVLDRTEDALDRHGRLIERNIEVLGQAIEAIRRSRTGE